MNSKPLFSDESRIMMEHSTMAFAVYTPSNAIFDVELVSDGFCKMFENTRENLIAHISSEHVFDNIPEKEKVIQTVKEFASLGKPYNVVYHEYVGNPKHLITVHALGHNEFTEDGRRYTVISFDLISDKDRIDLSTDEIIQKNAQMQVLFKMIKSGSWQMLYDDQMNYVSMDWDNNTRQMVGWSEEEYPSDIESLCRIMHPEDFQYFSGSWHEFLHNQEEEYIFEYRLKTKTRGYRWFRVSCRRGLIDDINYSHFFGIFVDITDEKLSAEAAKEHEQEEKRINAVYDIIGAARWQWKIDPNGEAYDMWWNPKLSSMFGYSATDTFDMTVENWVAHIHPEDRPRIVEITENFNASKEITTYNEEYRIITEQGDIRWVRKVGRKIPGKDGNYTEAIGTYTDITDQKEADTRMLMIRGLAQEYVSLWYFNTSDGLVRLISHDESSRHIDEVLRFDNHQLYEDALKAYIEQYVDPDDKEKTYQNLRTSFLIENVNDYKVHYCSFAHCDDDGRKHYLEACTARVQNEADGVYHFVIGFRDIDAMMRAETEKRKALNEALDKAQAASEAKSTFLFNMSHDIRTPLNAIMGFLGLAQKSDQTTERNNYLQKTQHATQQLTDILNNILEMARIERGTIHVDPEIINTVEFFNSEISIFEKKIEEKKIKLVTHNDIKHQYVYADKTLLAEVYLNLLSNAYKYTPVGGQITISSVEYESDKPGECIIVSSIEDDGLGMSDDFINHAFDEFSRDRNEHTTNVQGTGLGLAIVKKLVDLMGGTIDIESELGKGSKFTIRLPHKIAEKKSSSEEQTQNLGDYQALFVGKRILIAEDNDLNAEIAISILDDCGLTSERAENGLLCVQKHQEMPAGYYDCILMDIQMPIMDGYKATHEIRSMKDPAKASIPIIALSANAFKEDIAKSIEAGMNDHLAKPIDISQLISTIAKHLQ